METFNSIDAELAESEALDNKPTAARLDGGGDKLSELDVLNQCLPLIPASKAEPYSDWILGGAAIHSVDPGIVGLEAFKTFSAKCPSKYDPAECEGKWRTFRSNGGVTIATLIKWVQDAGGKIQFYKKHNKPNSAEGVARTSFLTFANYTLEVTQDGDDTKPDKRALSMPDVSSELFSRTDENPKRVDNLLFTQAGKDVRWLESTEDLFAWIQESFRVQWAQGAGFDGVNCIPKSEFLAHLQYACENFSSVETLPHEPKMDRHFYLWDAPADYKPTGEYLNKLLSFFDNYESEHDRALIRAMFCTPASGGMPGTRPAFPIVAPDRGCGKSTLKDAVAELYGGAVELDGTGTGDDRITSRLLSTSALTRRVVGIDNLKRQLNSGTVEALITATEINGHRLYHGDARRPNTLTFIITGNGLRLSRDMAERSFIIKLKRPAPRENWREAVFAFIRENRDRILSDVLMQLRGKRQGKASDRWQGWVDNVSSAQKSQFQHKQSSFTRSSGISRASKSATCGLSRGRVVMVTIL